MQYYNLLTVMHYIILLLVIKNCVFADVNLYLTKTDDRSINATCFDTRPDILASILLINSTNDEVGMSTNVTTYFPSRCSNLNCKSLSCLNMHLSYYDQQWEYEDINIKDNDNERFARNLSIDEKFLTTVLGVNMSFHLKAPSNNNCPVIALSNDEIIYEDVNSNVTLIEKLVWSNSKWKTFELEYINMTTHTLLKLKINEDLFVYYYNQSVICSPYLFTLESQKKTYWIDYRYKRLFIYGKIINTKVFEVYTNRLCITFRLSSSAECVQNVVVERNGTRYARKISTSNWNWENVRLVFNFPNSNRYNVTLSFEPLFNQKCSYQIADLQECIEDYISINAVFNPTTTNISCQKLNTNNIVSKTSIRSISKCTSGYFGQYCDISCGNYFGQQHEHCKGVLMCRNGSCSCATGYTGQYCQQEDNNLVYLLYLLVLIPILIILIFMYCFLSKTKKTHAVNKKQTEPDATEMVSFDNDIYSSANDNVYSVVQ